MKPNKLNLNLNLNLIISQIWMRELFYLHLLLITMNNLQVRVNQLVARKLPWLVGNNSSANLLDLYSYFLLIGEMLKPGP